MVRGVEPEPHPVGSAATPAPERAVASDAAVTVVGVDAAGNPPHPGLAAALSRAGLVVGAARHLAATPVPPGVETLLLGAVAPALDRLGTAVAAGTPAVVLASADPGFFGIVRRLRVAGLPVRVLPAVSSVAAAFGRVGLPWDGAAVVTAHGRDPRAALNACRALPLVAVLTAPGAGAAELAAGLVGWPRTLVVAEHLGTDAERITWTTPEEGGARAWADPHVLLSIAAGGPHARVDAARADNQPAAAPTGGWALPESAYAHRDSMVTKAEARALVVARLRPRLGRLVWDVGAGSGSVGVECALLGAAVVAIERDPAAVALVRANAARHGVEVRLVPGSAPDALAGLPEPDAVFVGGGGSEVLAAVAALRPPRIVVALAALDRIVPARNLLRESGYVVHGVQLSAARLADLPGGSVRLAAANPVVVLTGERP
ncbi:precorrin-6y C5,15-methyltransferase (decarboxylating) subunit CbiE [Micromonospora sp. WMMA1363]|uniref:precorrin-6y C5,15-methyltransferase (decarboxylating) subunit CbiE n=1 Tax=Micromonospora sp. WMMA1363 TaxID=3053985 RepID=UPI00259C69B6|nr:precorrin-6y C5,15-methyltransferase (decarboxylating) subunit CbiE [Micromonospora sp. WMMA1363]MDM4718972.1 precorrin-6y C5,15-methyltransferase (decarboxylating) subunit CbiE [Micromonospora sp. WMMA1363]